MKLIKLHKLVTVASLTLAVVGFAFTPSTAVAQDKGVTRLIPLRTPVDIKNVQAGDTIIMSCPKCKDTYASVVESSFKGTPDVKKVAMHLCPTCETRITTKGWGKSAKDVLVHVCKTCGSKQVSCCVMKKGETSTPGMGEKK